MNNVNNESPTGGLSRRRMLQLLGASAGAAALSTAGTSQAAEVDSLLPFTPRGRITRRPNFLVIVVDEMRYAPIYDVRRNFKRRGRRHEPSATINSISKNGMTFRKPPHHGRCLCAEPSLHLHWSIYPRSTV